MLPSGSLNHATLLPSGVVQMPRVWSWAKGYFSGGGAAVAEPGGDGFDVFDLPAEDGALQRSETWNLDDANHVAADAHDERKFIQADELESELAFVKGAGFVVVLGGDEADDFS